MLEANHNVADVPVAMGLVGQISYGVFGRQPRKRYKTFYETSGMSYRLLSYRTPLVPRMKPPVPSAAMSAKSPSP
ncbi:hypothetical protein [Paenibacillus motobuensis]|uniref:Uncharacterized protein n=1 Tax=Paenibacillus motobuensis TaxID=295324 RepID=A0ABN0YDN8_9BACL